MQPVLGRFDHIGLRKVLLPPPLRVPQRFYTQSSMLQHRWLLLSSILLLGPAIAWILQSANSCPCLLWANIGFWGQLIVRWHLPV